MISAEDIRKKVRISHAYMDDDIQSDINAARLDMSRVGVDISKDDALVDKAVELYCKAQINYLDRGEEFLKGYEKLRDGMSLTTRYKEVEIS
jgi:hypothetical protein